MKLHLNIAHTFHLRHLNPKVIVFSNSFSESEVLKTTNTTSIKNPKLNIKKLSPLHWFDGVWDNLDYKM